MGLKVIVLAGLIFLITGCDTKSDYEICIEKIAARNISNGSSKESAEAAGAVACKTLIIPE